MEARGRGAICQSLTVVLLTQPGTLLLHLPDVQAFRYSIILVCISIFLNSKLHREMYPQLTVSLKTQAEIIFFTRFSRCPFLYHVRLTIQLRYLLIITTKTRQPLMGPSGHVISPIFKSSTSQRSSACKLSRARQMLSLANTHTWFSIIPDSLFIPCPHTLPPATWLDSYSEVMCLCEAMST